MSRMRVGRPTASEMRLDPRRVLPGAEPELAGEAECAGHADGDALAVDEPARNRNAVRLSKRVAEGVAEIEQRALALLGLVGDDDARLGRATHRDRLRPRRAAGKHVPPARLEEFEEVPVADQAVFDHLGVAGAEFARAQGVERARSPRAPARAGGRRRRGSCRAAN